MHPVKIGPNQSKLKTPLLPEKKPSSKPWVLEAMIPLRFGSPIEVEQFEKFFLRKQTVF